MFKFYVELCFFCIYEKVGGIKNNSIEKSSTHLLFDLLTVYVCSKQYEIFANTKTHCKLKSLSIKKGVIALD